ncbi:hypothetical protein ACWEVD_14620 [Nocardia thailandica]
MTDTESRSPRTVSVPADYRRVVSEDDADLAFRQWRAGLQALTDSSAAARLWRERRYAFAHRLGEHLVAPTPTHPPVWAGGKPQLVAWVDGCRSSDSMHSVG